jgi:hypothetical protein
VLTWVKPFDTLLYIERPSPHPTIPRDISTTSAPRKRTPSKRRHFFPAPTPRKIVKATNSPQETTLNPLTCLHLNALMVALTPPSTTSSNNSKGESSLDSTLTNCQKYLAREQQQDGGVGKIMPPGPSMLDTSIIRSEMSVIEALIRPLDCGNFETSAPELGCTINSGAVRRVVYLPEPKKDSILHGKGGGWKNQHIVFFVGLLMRRHHHGFPNIHEKGVREGSMGGDAAQVGGSSTFSHFIAREYLWYMIVDDDTYFIPHNLNLALGSFILRKREGNHQPTSLQQSDDEVVHHAHPDASGSVLRRYAPTSLGMGLRSRLNSAAVMLADAVMAAAKKAANASALLTTQYGSMSHTTTDSEESEKPHQWQRMIIPLYPGCITKTGHCNPLSVATAVQRTPAMTGFVMSWGVIRPMTLKYLIHNLYNDLVSDPTNANVIPNYFDIVMNAASLKSPLYDSVAMGEVASAVRKSWYGSYATAVAQRGNPPDLLTPLLSGGTPAELVNAYLKLHNFSEDANNAIHRNKPFVIGMRSAFVHGGAGILLNSDAMEELGWAMSANRGVTSAASAEDSRKAQVAKWFCGIVGTLLPHGDVRLGFCATKRGISMRRFSGVYYEPPDSAIRKGHTDRRRREEGSGGRVGAHPIDPSGIPYPLSFHRVKDVLELDGMMEAVSRSGGRGHRGAAFIGWDVIYDRYDTVEESTSGSN